MRPISSTQRKVFIMAFRECMQASVRVLLRVHMLRPLKPCNALGLNHCS